MGKLPNVKIYSKRVTEMQKEKEIGRWKVIEYALRERGLPVEEPKGREATDTGGAGRRGEERVLVKDLIG